MARIAKPELHRDPHPRIGAAAPRRGQPVILKEPVPVKTRCAEVAGGTAANCAAVACCCPIGLVSLLVLAIVRLPAGLCRRALRKRAKRRKEIKRRKAAGTLLGPKAAAAGAPANGSGVASVAEMEEDEELVAVAVAGSDLWTERASPAAEAEEMERELWGKFYGTGFWRSLSQREDER